MHDPRSGDLTVALDHGHFGVKLHRSRGGGSWDEIPAPKYPEKPADYKPKTPAEGLGRLVAEARWALQPGGADQPGVIWCGTLPGGLFARTAAATAGGLNRQLWDDPRQEEWFGGGADRPGIRSIVVDPH
ncbi:MAG: hypothetical protein R2724_25410 [Bryobacterales bacterium]